MPPGTVQSDGNPAAKDQKYMEFLPDKQKKKKQTNSGFTLNEDGF